MNTNIVLLKFNNYYNRKVRYYSSLSDYLDYEYTVRPGVNFIPNDGVTTELIVNAGDLLDFDYNYLLLVVQEGTGFSTDSIIKQRWFILDAKRTRNGQYRLSLKRDSIVDYIEALRNATLNIHRKKITSVNDIAIYNREQFTFNQIKQSENILQDNLHSPWIVGYYTKKDTPESITVTAPTSSNENIISIADITDLPVYQYNNSTFNWVFDNTMMVDVATGNTGNPNVYGTTINIKKNSLTSNAFVSNPLIKLFVTPAITNDNSNALKTAMMNSMSNVQGQITLFEKLITDEGTGYTSTNYYTEYNNKYYYDTSTSKLWKVKITFNTVGATGTHTASENTKNDINAYIRNNCSFTYNGTNHQYDSNLSTYGNIHYQLFYYIYNVVFEEQNIDTLTITIPDNANDLVDEGGYCMFAVPYHSIVVNDGTDTTTEENNYGLISRLALKLGSQLKDLQLLPYCPLNENISNSKLDITALTEGIDYNWIKDSSNVKKSIVVFPKIANFSFNISYTINVPNTAKEFKIMNETSFARLVSPNGASVFEFKPTMNNGVTLFNVDCTYKPFNPYIKLNPDFKNLYGSDFNDYQGLICQGDFSLPYTQSQWEEYQINNKNYLNAFNRELDSMDKQFNLGRVSSGIASAIGATGHGIAAGLLGGPVLGGIVGVGSAIGAGADLGIQTAQYSEQKSLKQDMFNFNIDNIKARPNTIAKVSAIDYNNKLYPYIEIYDCTDNEKELLGNYLDLFGYNYNRIGYLQEDGYIQADIVLIDDTLDQHITSDINNELLQGVRF